MEDSVLSFLKAERKVSHTGSAHWASSNATFSNISVILWGSVWLVEWKHTSSTHRKPQTCSNHKQTYWSHSTVNFYSPVTFETKENWSHITIDLLFKKQTSIKSELFMGSIKLSLCQDLLMKVSNKFVNIYKSFLQIFTGVF